MKKLLKNSTNIAYKGIVFWIFFWLTVFSVAYAASITSTTDPTVTSWDSITANWYQDVNDKLGGISVSGGNVGIGTTPTNWSSLATALQIGNSSLHWYGNNAYLTNNYYYNGSSNTYINDGYASSVDLLQSWWIRFRQANSWTSGTTANLTESMRIDSSGNVWIGFDTIYNNDRLYVDGAITAGTNWATNGSTLIQNRYSEAANRYTNVLWTLYSSASWAIGRSVRPKSGAAGYVSSNELNTAKSSLEVWSNHLSFKMAPKSLVAIGDDVSMTTKFHIDKNWQVGIGTTTPGAKLDVKTTDWQFINLDRTDTPYVDDIFSLWVSYSSDTNDFVTLWKAWSKDLNVTDVGNVWIWTTTPGAKLEVNGNIKASYYSPYNIWAQSTWDANWRKLGTLITYWSHWSYITVEWTRSYSAWSKIAGRTHIILRWSNSWTSLEWYFYWETMWNSTISQVAYKNIGWDYFEIYVKPSGTYSGLETFIKTWWKWLDDLATTWSTTQPSSTTLLTSLFTVTTSGTERMRIDSSGNVWIWTTAPNVALDVNGSIEYTGTITDVSDGRLKENIKDIEGALENIDKIRAVSFEMKDDEENKVEFWVIAQELEKIYPELVNTADDEMGTKSVNYVGLIGPLVEAVKELKKQNEEMKEEIELLKNK